MVVQRPQTAAVAHAICCDTDPKPVSGGLPPHFRNTRREHSNFCAHRAQAVCHTAIFATIVLVATSVRVRVVVDYHTALLPKKIDHRECSKKYMQGQCHDTHTTI